MDREPYKASGPGGQHRNKTETAIRLRHRPTGVVAQCCSERSQSYNEEAAWKMLQAKLDKMVEDYRAEQKRQGHKSKPKASFGNQIRSYVLTGNAQRVVDHRTGASITVGQWQKGDIDPLIVAYLRSV